MAAPVLHSSYRDNKHGTQAVVSSLLHSSPPHRSVQWKCLGRQQQPQLLPTEAVLRNGTTRTCLCSTQTSQSRSATSSKPVTKRAGAAQGWSSSALESQESRAGVLGSYTREMPRPCFNETSLRGHTDPEYTSCTIKGF